VNEAAALTQVVVYAVVAGVAAQVLAGWLRLPSIVFLLLFGVALGNNGLGWIRPQILDVGLDTIVSLSVALILFEGGLNLPLQELGKVSASLRNLVTLGALVTLLGGGLAAHFLAEFPWPIAFLYASLVVVTGPTVINPLVKNLKLERRVALVLEGEGVLIDALGAVLAVVVLQVVLNSAATATEVVGSLVSRLGVGAAVGVGAGWLVSQFLLRATFLDNDLKSSVVLAAVFGFFHLSERVQSESGLMAAVLMGLVVRAFSLPSQRLLIQFKSQLTVLIVSILFVLLAANLSIPSLFALGWGGPLTVAVLMLLVRPLNIWLCTWKSSFTWRQKLFLAWCAPRGIVAASVASLFAIVLTQRGINGGDAIKALVFLTIAMTVFLQGLTAGWVAKGLRLTAGDLTGVAIVGANPVSLLVAQQLQSNRQSVVIVDTSVAGCREAEAAGIRAVLANGLDVRALAQAGLDALGTFLAMTVNPDVNLVLAQRVLEEFRPPRTLAVYPRQEGDGANPSIHQAFGNRVLLKAWNQYLTQREATLSEFILGEDMAEQLTRLTATYTSGKLLPLLYERKQRLNVVTANMVWEKGDRIVYLLHTPRALPPSPETALDPAASTIEITADALPELKSREQREDRITGSKSERDYLDMARDLLKYRRG